MDQPSLVNPVFKSYRNVSDTWRVVQAFVHQWHGFDFSVESSSESLANLPDLSSLDLSPGLHFVQWLHFADQVQSAGMTSTLLRDLFCTDWIVSEKVLSILSHPEERAWWGIFSHHLSDDNPLVSGFEIDSENNGEVIEIKEISPKPLTDFLLQRITDCLQPPQGSQQIGWVPAADLASFRLEAERIFGRPAQTPLFSVYEAPGYLLKLTPERSGESEVRLVRQFLPSEGEAKIVSEELLSLSRLSSTSP